MEAEYVEIQKPSFDARLHSRDKPEAIKHAKALPLASLSSDITAVRLRNLSDVSLGGKDVTYDHLVRERIRDLTDHSYQAYAAYLTKAPNQSSRPLLQWNHVRGHPMSPFQAAVGRTTTDSSSDDDDNADGNTATIQQLIE